MVRIRNINLEALGPKKKFLLIVLSELLCRPHSEKLLYTSRLGRYRVFFLSNWVIFWFSDNPSAQLTNSEYLSRLSSDFFFPFKKIQYQRYVTSNLFTAEIPRI